MISKIKIIAEMIFMFPGLEINTTPYRGTYIC